MRDDPEPAPRVAAAPAEMLWLLGQPHLSDYLEFVREQVAGGTRMCPRALADEWRAANDLYFRLEEEEAGIADTIGCRPAPAQLKPLVERLMASPEFRNTFDTFAMSVEMVELDKLIVSQPYVTCSFSEERARLLGARPSPQALFHYCQPLERELPPVRIEQTDEGRFVFSSNSTDLRPHRLRLLRGAEIGVDSYGPVAAMVGMMVGFGSNFFTAVRSEQRLVLHNGYHRAHAMRAAGVTHAPCLVQTVTRLDELRVAASDKVSSDPAFYFRSKRPPIFKDFFDPRLAKRFALRPQRRIVEVEVVVRKMLQVEADAA
jgi:hypothetical protein